MIKSILLIGTGSCLGGILRFFISFLFKNIKFIGIPIGIFIVNIIGCFLIGAFFSYFREKITDNDISIFLMTGVLGGFTTFSSFSLEVLQLFQGNEPLKAVFYMFGTAIIGILACFLGYKSYHLF